MKSDHTTTFNTAKHAEDVERMKERTRTRGESVHSEGQKVFRETGQLDKMVNVYGKKRVSRNAFQDNGDGTCTLLRGIKLPVISKTDGTGSMGENVAKAFFSMQGIYAMLSGIEDRYQIDLSVAVVQDVCDTHPVFQMAEFESDNRAAEHVKLLIPDKDGGDAIEDYDLGLWYVDNAVETDITRYGLKGYLFLIADEIGRGVVNANNVKTHLGHEMQTQSISTQKICQNLLTKWHFFYIQVKGSGRTSNWWEEMIGEGRVIQINNSDLLAEVQAGLVYVTENLQPTESGLIEFLLASGNNKRISERDAKTVWSWLQTARPFFGAQAKLPGFNEIPKPGDVFANYRDTWPISHSKSNDDKPTDSNTAEVNQPVNEKIDWGKF